MSLGYNKVCELEDFESSELAPVIREVCEYKMARLPAAFPAGCEHRKDWEVAMAVRSLRDHGALHREARILGVGAGTEDTVFFLTRHAGQVFATDRYVASGAWQPLAPLSMMVEPDLVAPFPYEQDRLVVQHMDGRALRYPDNTFDGIFSSGSIEHFGTLSDVAASAYEMGRVLKPGGILALSTEFQFSGPPGGIGWEYLTLVLSEENLHRYIVEASGLELVDDLRPSVSDGTLATPRDLTLVLQDHLARVAAKGGVEAFTEWDFPHLILVQGGYVWGSVHLTLRKAAEHPVVANRWARPSEAVRDSIVEYNRSLVGPAIPIVEPEPAVPTEAGSASRVATAAAVDTPSRDDMVGQNDQDREDLCRWVETIEHRTQSLESALANADEVLLGIDGWRHDVDECLAMAMERQLFLRQWECTTPAVSTGTVGVTGFDDPDSVRARIGGVVEPGLAWREVTVDSGVSFHVLVDLSGHDLVAEILATGTPVDQNLLDLMFAVVRPGDFVLDLGAHVGTFTLSAAAAGCRVVAVEAAPANVSLLRTSLARNGFHSAQVVHAAASDEPGSVEFHAGGAVGSVEVGTGPASSHTNPLTITVPAVRVEDVLVELNAGAPAFVKIDVEGSEPRALKGLAGLLSGPAAPPVLIESNGHTLRLLGSSPEELLAALEDMGYKSYLVEGRRLVRCSSAEVQPQTLVDYLAVKRPPGTLSGWRVESGMGLDERLRRVVADCAHPNPHHRAYMAAMLSTTADPIARHPEVLTALSDLAHDPDDGVRAVVTARSSEPPDVGDTYEPDSPIEVANPVQGGVL